MSATSTRYAAQKDCLDPLGPGLAPWSVWDHFAHSPIATHLNKSTAHHLAAQLNAGIAGIETLAGFRRAACPFCSDENAVQNPGLASCSQCGGEFNVVASARCCKRKDFEMAIIPSTPLDRMRVVAGLLRLRRELDQVAAEEKLTLAETWQGMLLADVAQAIGLSPDEQQAVLGFAPEMIASARVGYQSRPEAEVLPVELSAAELLLAGKQAAVTAG